MQNQRLRICGCISFFTADVWIHRRVFSSSFQSLKNMISFREFTLRGFSLAFLLSSPNLLTCMFYKHFLVIYEFCLYRFYIYVCVFIHIYIYIYIYNRALLRILVKSAIRQSSEENHINTRSLKFTLALRHQIKFTLTSNKYLHVCSTLMSTTSNLGDDTCF
jgi:hypothetical protein